MPETIDLIQCFFRRTQRRKSVVAGIALATTVLVSALFAQVQVPRTKWKAQWIAHPTAALREPGVFHFRKVLRLESKPIRFVVHVSADNRFQLFVNGKRVGEGPARSDLQHWRYETFDLASFLRSGENVIAATVWQFGIYAPLAQISDRTAFLVEGDAEAEALVNTGSSWQVEQELGHTPQRPMPEGMWQYWAAGPGERIDGNLYDWRWKEPAAGTEQWVTAAPAIRESIYPGGSTPVARLEDTGLRWLLVPDPLPPMEYKEVPAGKVVRTNLDAAKAFPLDRVTVPAHTKATLLVDHETMVTAYPELVVSGGKGARIQLVYTEALYDEKQQRGNRNEVGNRVALGLTDEFLPDGGQARSLMPLWWRTWRYLEVSVETADEPVRLDSLRTYFTAYPFEEKGTFTSSDPELAKIREICWRGARLGAHETYVDTPYWEQLQYIGDTRIQALISYVVSGDDRLARQALEAFDESRIPEGLTQSRYPSSLAQFIPPFSLLWVNMLHDYWMYRPDKEFVAELLPGTRPVLDWFLRRQRQDGFLGRLPAWGFVDTPQGDDKFPPLDEEGRSSVLTLQFIGALQGAAEMEAAMGDSTLAVRYRKQAQSAAEGIYKHCWNAKLGLLADTPEQTSYSQHANLLAVLHDVIPRKDQATVMRRILASELGKNDEASPKLSQVSLFFQFYLARAMEHSGTGEYYVQLLQPWRHMLAMGLTTAPEYPDPSRSDTHAWSAHPAYDLATMVAGIRPDAPGFAKVHVEPNLGNLEWVEASMPHAAGTIQVSYRRNGAKLDATVTLPQGLPGRLIWKGKEYPLREGEQRLSLP